MPVIEGTDRLKTAISEYDFAVDGGAVGNIPLRGVGTLGGSVPPGSVIYGGYVEVITPLASGGAATAGISLEGAGDLVAPALVSTASWNAGGRKNVVPSGTGATTVKTTAARGHTLAVGAFALTAGKVRVVTFYI